MLHIRFQVNHVELKFITNIVVLTISQKNKNRFLSILKTVICLGWCSPKLHLWVTYPFVQVTNNCLLMSKKGKFKQNKNKNKNNKKQKKTKQKRHHNKNKKKLKQNKNNKHMHTHTHTPPTPHTKQTNIQTNKQTNT